ncbi:MAG: ferric uptake regulator, Fur family [Chloroflexi bacterium]|nr:ferric uptake regulator, Fur family [Chloroflexota bacterium]
MQADAHALRQDRAGLILGRIAEQGHRMTGPRQTVVECVARRNDTFSAQEILDQLTGQGLPIGRATVFRTLELLTELAFLHRIHNEDGCHLFTVCAERDHHHHVRCVSCGMVETLEAPTVEAEIRRVVEGRGFDLLDHVIDLVGLCSRCRPST